LRRNANGAGTTLDRLIELHGKPCFIKIDVEGYECEVVKGLSQSVGTLSIEFTPEIPDPTLRCIDHLAGLGDVRLNYAVAETMDLLLDNWVSPREMAGILASFQGDNSLFGDVYVRVA
jgi:hypothetical protein